jgi:DNA-directed RNA polymerase subunit omega
MSDTQALLAQYRTDEFDSRHRIAVVAAQRAKHIVQGAKLAGGSKFTKATTIAIDEVLHHQVQYVIGEAARLAMKEAKRGKESELEHMASAQMGEDAREIKKELSVYVDDSNKGTQPDAEE